MDYRVFTLSNDEIKQNSVIQIQTEEEVYSNKLGSTGSDQCGTCGLTLKSSPYSCLGHTGYIQLNIGYYHPLYYKFIQKLIKGLCLNCLNWSDHQTHCPYCSKKIEPAEITELNKILLYIQMNKSQLANVMTLIYDKQLPKMSTNQLIKVDPKLMQDVFDYICKTPSFKKLGVSSKFMHSLVLDVVPVISNTFRISQPELQMYSQISAIYLKILRLNSVLNLRQNESEKGLYFDVDQTQNRNLYLLYTCVYSLMSPKQQKPILEKIGVKKPEQMISVLAFSLGKSGFFRANLNGVRVNCSCRTVITPDPYLLCDQVGCPKVIAEQITVPIRVNSENIGYLRGLINNWPNYPCALMINNTQFVNDRSKEYLINQLIPGDIVNRQVLDNDICLSNRYPSVREESFGCYRTKISNQQSIQFNLSVVKKHNADFDGDEMQLFFLPSPKDNIEIALLSSAYQQFIEYTTQQNIVGGSKDLNAGIYHINKLSEEKSSDNKFLNQFTGDKILNYISKFVGAEEYKDKKITIESGRLEKIDKSLASAGSNFLLWLYFHYGPSFCLNTIDQTMRLCYKINEALNFSLYCDIFNTSSQAQEKYEKSRINDCNKLLEEYYTGKFKSPMGVDRKKFFTQYLTNTLSLNEDVQKEIIVQQFTGPGHIKLYNDSINDIQAQMLDATVSLRFRDDDEGHMFDTVPRMFCCYPKFSLDIRHQGYTTENYMNGVDSTTQYLIAWQGRHQAYVRGNSIRDTGYMQRKVQKAFDCVYTGQNQIIYGNNKTIISLQVGQYSFDSRLNVYEEVEWHDSWSAEQKDIFRQLMQIQQQCGKDNLKVSDSTLTFGLPFKPTQTKITRDELQAILSCRICENMSEQFKQIIYLQSWYFWAYCFLTMEITSGKSDYKIVEDYLRSIIPPGDSIGIKSAMAITGPLSQDTLDAIHKVKTASGKIQYFSEDALDGSHRFLELTQCQTQYISFEAKLLKSQDETLASEFVQKYQTLPTKILKPKIDIYFSNKSWYLDFIVKFDTLAYNNVDLQQLVDQLIEFLGTKKVSLTESSGEIILSYQFAGNIEPYQLNAYRTKLLTDFKFGSGFLYNVYYLQRDKDNYIKGNIVPKHVSEIFLIKELDPENIYVNDILYFNDFMGINKTEHQLYNEYYTTVTGLKATKNTCKMFFNVMSSFQTQTGNYEGFQRFSYKKDKNRDFIQNIVYEEGSAFIQKEVQQPIWRTTQSYQNSQIFGCKSGQGTEISEYFA